MKNFITILILLVAVGCSKPADSIVGTYQHDSGLIKREGTPSIQYPLSEITLRTDKVFEIRKRDHPPSKPKVFKTEKEKKDWENTGIDFNKTVIILEQTTAAERKPKVGRWEVINSEVIVTFQQSIRYGSEASAEGAGLGYYNYYAMDYYRVEDNGDLKWVAQGRKIFAPVHMEERKDFTTEDFKTFKKVK